MKKIISLVLLALVVMTLLLGGCKSKDNDIKNQEEASEALTDVGQGVEDIDAALGEIGEGLG